MDSSRVSRRRLALAACLLLIATAARVAAVFTVGVNWDEFVLLDRAARTAEAGQLHTGGRPGLGVLMLLPLVDACDDEIRSVRAARCLWLLLTAAFLAGLYRTLRPLVGRGDAWLGVALLACVPAFLEWSIQVRTDQIALAGGTWGAAFLLASRRRAALALAAGILLGIGYLGSQKLVYVAALAGLLAAGDAWRAGDLRPRRDALRGLACAAGFALVFLVHRAAVATLFDVPEAHASQHLLFDARAVGRTVSLFDFYRNTIGWSQYRALLPSLGPHLLLLAGLVAASLLALRRTAGETAALGRQLALAWAVLALGGAVAAFHAAAFFYFWMTLGLFPAVALALARRPLRELAPPFSRRARTAVVAAWWLLLAAPAALQLGRMLEDSQAVQRESLAFLRRNFASEAGGFQPERAPFCRAGAHPLPVYFSQTIYRHFVERDGTARTAQLVDVFRQTPILYLVNSFRLNQFPVELRRFWAENYQPYRGSVFVAGRHLAGASGTRGAFELVAAGRYRWLPFSGAGPIVVDGQRLEPGDVLDLEAGAHSATFVEDVAGGMLVLAVAEPPGPAPLAFYKAY